jgi:hypothetical protein
MVQVEFDNRSNQYNGDVAEAKDQNSIELYQLKPAEVIKAPFVKLAAVARLLAQLAVQRQVYIRNDYGFTLPMRYALLEPMDFVTLTDSILGLNQTLVRIKEIDENDDETFSVVAEEWTVGVGTAPNYGSTSTGGAPTPTGWEKSPAMPGVSASFDANGQLILNLSGDSRTVRHIYKVRTDRLPTIPETRAGTAVAFAGQANIATGITVLPGQTAYIGDLAYNSIGGESAQSTAVIKREGTDVDTNGRLKQPKGDIENLISNSGGEEGATGVQADGWTYGLGANVTPDTSLHKFGDRSLTLYHPSANDSVSYQDFTVADGDVYELSGWIKVSSLSGAGSGAILNMEASGGMSFAVLAKVGYDPTPSQPDVGIATATGTSDWTFVRCVFRVVGSGSMRLYLQLGYSGTVSGQAWFDGLKLARVHRETNEGGYRAFNTHDVSRRIKRAVAGDDGLYSLRATENDGSTKSSSAIKGQGSVVPTVMANQILSYAAGGPSSSAMWIAFSWSAFTLRLPDGTTISVPASSSLPTPATPSLSQVAAGSLGGRTLFARIGLVKNGMIYRVGAEASLAVSAFNVLYITSPSAVSGYDGWVPLVGSATNAEKLQSTQIAFGTDWQEPNAGFDSTGTPFNTTNWPNSVVAAVLTANVQYFFYPWYDLTAGIVIFPDAGQTARSDTAAASQNSDGRVPISAFTAVDVTTPLAGNAGSGSKGGNKYL